MALKKADWFKLVLIRTDLIWKKADYFEGLALVAVDFLGFRALNATGDFPPVLALDGMLFSGWSLSFLLQASFQLFSSLSSHP